jgi:hypothetical protein
MRRLLLALVVAAAGVAFGAGHEVQAQYLSTGGPTPPSAIALGLASQQIILTGSATGQYGVTYEPDMHASILKSNACVTNGYCLWGTGILNSATGSTFLLTTTNFTSFSNPLNDGAGNALPVLQPTCPLQGAGCRANFDAAYAGCNQVWVANNGTDLLCFYHGETRCFGSTCNAHTPFYAEAGVARMPGGVANPEQTFTPGTAVLSSNDSIPTANPTSLPNGVPEGTLIVPGDGNMYAVLADFPTNCCGYPDAGANSYLEIARAAASGDGAAGTWTKFYQGAYGTQAGLGGLADDLFAANGYGTCVQPRQPFLTFSTTQFEYVLIFLCNKGYYYSLSASIANPNFSTPQQFFFPAFTPFTSGVPMDENAVFFTPGNANTMTIGATGLMLYAHTQAWSNTSHNLWTRSFQYGPTPPPTPTPSPTPDNAFQTAVVAQATPLYFWRLNGTGSTEASIGTSTQAITYNGTGTQGGAALDNDTGSASYSPNANASNYALAASSIANWPAATIQTATELVMVKVSSADCGGTVDLINTFGPVNGTNTATFGLYIVADGTSCHVVAKSDEGSNSASTANGTLTVGSTYAVGYIFNKSGSPALTAVVCQLTCVTGTNAASYMFAWTNTNGPVMIGQDASKTTQNVPNGTSLVQGPIADAILWPVALTTTNFVNMYTAAVAPTPSPVPTPTPAPTPTPTATPAPTETLPPEGLFNSCEVDSALSTCEADDLNMKTAGFTREVNYLGLGAPGGGSGMTNFAAYLAYDVSIGFKQIVSVKAAIQDSNPLTGTGLVTAYPSFSSQCGATNDQQVILCVHTVVAAQPGYPTNDGMAGLYLYDEPGCPNQSIGYCAGSLAGGNYQNIQTVATYWASIDTHPIFGVQTPSGVPPGGWTGSNAQPQISNLYSCNGQAPCNGVYPWITSGTTPNTGFDYYPYNCSGCTTQSINDINTIPGLMQNTFNASFAAEKMSYTGQAFSWYQELQPSCTGVGTTGTLCPYPTEAQIQAGRDKALYYANAAGNPLDLILYYEYAAVVCNSGHDPYPGCNATTNMSNLSTAAFAPIPTSPP